MAINLSKGQTINLDKNTNDLSQITIGLGWDVKKQTSGGFFGKLMGSKEIDADLDAVAFLLDENDKVKNLGRSQRMPDGREVILVDSDVIYFNNLRVPDGTVYHTGDNRTGQGDGDDEKIIVKLNTMDQRYHKILFIVSIYMGNQKNQHFGMIENAYIRAVDNKGVEIARYNLSQDDSYNGMASMLFGEVYRKDGGWKFRAQGQPYQSDNFLQILKKHIQ